jgi:argininosuccinate lyase
MSGGIARTSATGGRMLPALLEWSSSLSLDRQLVREDVLGSAAHITMLARQGLVATDDARDLRVELLVLYREASEGKLALADGEEDVHMAVEAELGRRLGAVAGKLHTARSRNDQVALDLRLHVRDQAAQALREVAALIHYLADRAPGEMDILLPAYTHRQRAQPISAAFQVCAWATQLARAAEVVDFALERVDVSPLGSGACTGTSLPIDRELVARLLGFPAVTKNALDTVGDRDFALDWTWAAARVLLALGKVAADLVDMSTSEFGMVRLDGEIAAGSSMMPQKKNPDIFELVRGKTARGIGNVTALLTLVKGLPSGYNRDQQEDRQTVLETAPLLRGTVAAMMAALPHAHFVSGEKALAEGFTQATDLAEALVRRGVPFREAYKQVGQLVRDALDQGKTLAQIESDPALDPRAAVAAKESTGGTGPSSVKAQIQALKQTADRLIARADRVPSFDALVERIMAEAL